MTTESKVIVRNGGIGFGGMLTLMLIFLKITGYANISWLWVFAPLWLPVVVVFGLMGIVFVFAAVATSLS
jgi:hypothetical protein